MAFFLKEGADCCILISSTFSVYLQIVIPAHGSHRFMWLWLFPSHLPIIALIHLTSDLHSSILKITSHRPQGRLAMGTHAVKLTYQDYLLLPEDNNRHEIIDGEHYMTPSPIPRHQRISKRLLMQLESFVRQKQVGEVFSAPIDVILSDVDVVVPDLIFISRERSSIITGKNIQGVPDLIIEILSPSTAERDRHLKRKTYAKFGVTEYWLVDPVTCTVHILRLHEGDYQSVSTFSLQQNLTSPLFQGLNLPLTEIFEE
jgi:Uma2 family endonuclease